MDVTGLRWTRRNKAAAAKGQASIDNAAPDDDMDACDKHVLAKVAKFGLTEVWQCDYCKHGEKRTSYGTSEMTPREIDDFLI